MFLRLIWNFNTIVAGKHSFLYDSFETQLALCHGLLGRCLVFPVPWEWAEFCCYAVRFCGLQGWAVLFPPGRYSTLLVLFSSAYFFNFAACVLMLGVCCAHLRPSWRLHKLAFLLNIKYSSLSLRIVLSSSSLLCPISVLHFRFIWFLINTHLLWVSHKLKNMFCQL